MKSDVFPLFSTPVGVQELNYEFSPQQKEFIESHSNKLKGNVLNHTSADTFVLDNPILHDFRTEITNRINGFFNYIYNPASECRLEITQSWLNYTTKSEGHHQHSHPNSVLSAVYYLNTGEEDSIIFHRKDIPLMYDFEVTNFNMINAGQWIIKAQSGLLVVFPSNLEHSVDTKKESNSRVSMAINTRLRGIVGSKDGLTYLEL